MRILLVLALLTMHLGVSNADELKATITSVGNDTVHLGVSGDLAPVPGDAVEIYYLIPGTDLEAKAAKGKVLSVQGRVVKVEITNRLSEIKEDYQARIVSPSPQRIDDHPIQTRRRSDSGSAGNPTPDSSSAVRRIDPLAQKYREQGLERGRSKDWVGAERLYRKALDYDNRDAESWNALGVALAEQGKPKEALKAYQSATRLKPGTALYWNNLGVTLRKDLKRYAEAEEVFRKAIELQPGDAPKHNSLGTALFEQKDYKQAALEYRKAIELDAKNGRYHANLAGAFLKDTRKTEAREEASKAIELGYRKNHWVYQALGLKVPSKREAGEARISNEITTLDGPPVRSVNPPDVPIPDPEPRNKKKGGKKDK